MMKTPKRFLLLFLSVLLFATTELRSAPPLFDSIGVERLTNSIYYVMEGAAFQFSVTAQDPDGDSLIFWAEDVPPNWAHFDSITRILSGVAPYWSDIDSVRAIQPGKFDIKFYVTDGIYTVEKIVTLMILDSLWDLNATMADLVATRPISSGGSIGTPVSFQVKSDSIIWTSYGGGKNIRKITIHYQSQEVDFDTIGWDCDAVVFLPENHTDSIHFGALVEGGYSGSFGEEILSLKTCAVFDIPVMIFDVDWDSGEGGNLYDECIDQAVAERDPGYLFLTYSTAHYLRSGDALISVIDSLTPAYVDFNTFKYAFTGHSKFGHTCVATALTLPYRVIGFMSSGAMDIDDNGTRLLTLYQGAQSSNPGASTPYIGVMTTYFQESLKINETTNPDQAAFFIMGSDDTKDVETKYMPKYASFLLKNQLHLENSRICMVPNAPHTTQTPFHSLFWETLLGNLTWGNAVPQIDSVWYQQSGGNFQIEAYLTGDTVTQVNVWATDEPDTNNSHWINFTNWPMSFVDGKYIVTIPEPVSSFYVEVRYSATDINGITTSEIFSANKNYQYLHLSPADVSNLQVTLNQNRLQIGWNNPPSGDFVNALVVYAANDYPQTPTQGTLLYDGNNEHCMHLLSDTSQTLYYTIFCYDSLGNYSSGVHFNSFGQVTVREIDPNTEADFFVYPNPASETVTIENVGGYGVLLTDMQGKIIFNRTKCVGDKLTFDVSNLSKGIYLFKIYTDSRNGNSVKKVIIK